ncbi:transmembrane amino acid transporter protein-domain-containing protein [Pavlovales sp. CCMP2436]|nr:transmembrane amino acid transporter protein-domain-containing protein [Pavlovales sp. CCMP2436]
MPPPEQTDDEEAAPLLHGGKAVTTPEADEPCATMGVGSSAVTLLKNIVGCSLLSLPAGQAALGGTGFVPAIGLTIFSALLAAFTLYTLGEGAAATRTSNYVALCAATLGARASRVVNAVILAFSLCADIMLMCVLAELAAALLTQSRNQALIGVTVLLLMPLALQHNFTALRYASWLGVAAVAVISLVLTMRWLDGSYGAGGRFAHSSTAGLVVMPSGGSHILSQASAFHVSSGSLVLFSMLSSAFTAHYNAPRLYFELNNATPVRFAAVCVAGFAGAALANALVMLTGYYTFGADAQGVILNNLSSDDPLAKAARLATCLSILTVHPLTFTGLRDATLSAIRGTALGDAVNRSRNAWAALTIGMVIGEMLIALLNLPLDTMVAFLGAVACSILVYIVPGCILLSRVREGNEQQPDAHGFARKALSFAIVAFGCAAAVAGVIATSADISGRQVG